MKKNIQLDIFDLFKSIKISETPTYNLSGDRLPWENDVGSLPSPEALVQPKASIKRCNSALARS